MLKQKSYKKYRNVKQTYNGRVYDSKREAAHAIELDWRIKAGEVLKVTPQYRLNIKVNGQKICAYIIDFKVDYADGTVELHEVKGYETDTWKLKWKLTKALLHDIEEYPEGAKLVLIK